MTEQTQNTQYSEKTTTHSNDPFENNDLANYVIYADTNKCRGCHKCEIACIASHYDMSIKEAVKRRKDLPSRIHVIKSGTTKLPIQCRQCENAPCAKVCPTHALIQTNGGKVVMRPQFCAGCEICMMACPYGAITRSFVKLSEEEQARLAHSEPRVVAVRCDLCQELSKKENRNVSACVEACPAKALTKVTIQEYRLLKAKNAPLPLADDSAVHETDMP
ncbi:4Fe-4S dicluster domain-containing protein [Desulfovibrio litoralis]|uniref:Carbon-monoxide dehydrogenase iron sulfur subunit n=1 Tax=Desulfovibrio litoralis DSM 11393 TaxID=1121455 RepID=A0A1M7S181_9BACT|nr:4Fe-4S dicluster domain-containing protein [Desulfovibrio litoralis]SHN52238.1 carbon-monoxide dehydrogenase iron sulfur subunit [Desulfovibrio litoralis DSM 11393]